MGGDDQSSADFDEILAAEEFDDFPKLDMLKVDGTSQVATIRNQCRGVSPRLFLGMSLPVQ